MYYVTVIAFSHHVSVVMCFIHIIIISGFVDDVIFAYKLRLLAGVEVTMEGIHLHALRKLTVCQLNLSHTTVNRTSVQSNSEKGCIVASRPNLHSPHIP